MALHRRSCNKLATNWRHGSGTLPARIPRKLLPGCRRRRRPTPRSPAAPLWPPHPLSDATRARERLYRSAAGHGADPTASPAREPGGTSSANQAGAKGGGPGAALPLRAIRRLGWRQRSSSLSATTRCAAWPRLQLSGGSVALGHLCSLPQACCWRHSLQAGMLEDADVGSRGLTVMIDGCLVIMTSASGSAPPTAARY